MPLLAVPNVTVHPSTASVPIAVLLYNGLLLCGFNVPTKGLIYTGWLKLKYPTGQNAISRQPCEIFIPKFLDLYGRDPAVDRAKRRDMLAL